MSERLRAAVRDLLVRLAAAYARRRLKTAEQHRSGVTMDAFNASIERQTCRKTSAAAEKRSVLARCDPDEADDTLWIPERLCVHTFEKGSQRAMKICPTCNGARRVKLPQGWWDKLLRNPADTEACHRRNWHRRGCRGHQEEEANSSLPDERRLNERITGRSDQKNSSNVRKRRRSNCGANTVMIHWLLKTY